MSGALTPVTVGFMPLLDCALLVAARESGIAASHGLDLRLVRETSWANVRDRLAIGHFDAAHLLGPMLVAENVGAGQLDVPLMAPVSLGLGGNAITLSRSLWQQMASGGAMLGDEPAQQAKMLARVLDARAALGEQPITLAMVFPFSCHNYQLRDWLVSGGIDPDHQVRLVVLPPPLLVDALRSGQVDGFCVGEPWNSLAVQADIGVIVATAAGIWQSPPEKVLALRERFAAQHPQTVLALVRAIRAAARWLGHPQSQQQLALWLAEPRHVGVPAALLLSTLQGSIVLAAETAARSMPDFVRFDEEATIPHPRHGELFYARLLRWGQADPVEAGVERARAGFRIDLYQSTALEVQT